MAHDSVLPLLGAGNTGVITVRVQFILDFTLPSPSLDILYDRTLKGTWKLSQLGFPHNQTIYPVMCCGPTNGGVTINAPLTPLHVPVVELTGEKKRTDDSGNQAC